MEMVLIAVAVVVVYVIYSIVKVIFGANRILIFFQLHPMTWFRYEEIKESTKVSNKNIIVATLKNLVDKNLLEHQIDVDTTVHLSESSIKQLQESDIDYDNIEYFKYRLTKSEDPWRGRKLDWKKFWDWLPKPKPQMARALYF